MGSKLEQESWNFCMAMLIELDDVFPYFPLPNYLWVHTTGSVLWVMHREREVYMEGIESVPLDKENIEMGDVLEDEVVPEEVMNTVEPERRDIETGSTISFRCSSFGCCGG